MRSAILAVTLSFVTVTSAADVLTLEKAIGTALEQNRSLLGATHELEAARWGKLSSYSNFLPKIAISSNFTRIDPETELRANAALDFIKASAGALGIPQSALSNLKPFAYRDAYSTDITLIQPVYNGGAEIVGLHAADATRDRSEYSYQDTEQDVIASVKISYLTVLKAEELVSLTKESAERTKRFLEMTERKAAVGMRTQMDVLRWQVQLAADEGSLIAAQNGLAAARLRLNDVLGVDLQTEFTLEKINPNDSLPAPDRELSSMAPLAAAGGSFSLAVTDPIFLDTHPSMRMMEANLRLADVNVERAWISFKPRLNLAFQYGWEKNNTAALDGIKPWALSFTLSYPIFNGFGDYTELEQARADYKRAETQVESYRRGLLLQATNAGLNLRASGKRIEIARKGMEHALDVLNSVTRRYETGAASNVDLIDVQTAYTSAKTDYITAAYDYTISEVQLARATGMIHK
jgi:outer membrane protein TolC